MLCCARELFSSGVRQGQFISGTRDLLLILWAAEWDAAHLFSLPCVLPSLVYSITAPVTIFFKSLFSTGSRAYSRQNTRWCIRSLLISLADVFLLSTINHHLCSLEITNNRVYLSCWLKCKASITAVLTNVICVVAFPLKRFSSFLVPLNWSLKKKYVQIVKGVYHA